ncbi:uncharacterized protein Z518_02691 [Rhinocladiella mackenziei CBS 650.93]|uniref:Alcohol acetyltransferase n=1 Tax=Rhinocladiella mackenziei CBS 650.93 TaxID=1442369 RepID=A0A0D2IXI3_9EURO|nr:uncharacterized protein Z518_02691 [Rhinocladiella mackenziei CBS 650.93]KIX08036.1 hypothetical protein Z518_02691 [Rhinocladiella mackenziei CBS 650.93]
MDIEKFERLRPLGRLEQYSTARHDLRFYLHVAITASYMLTLPTTTSTPTDPQPGVLRTYIYQACARAIGKHPILSAIPVGENTQSPQFARLPEIDLEKCVLFQERQPSTPAPDRDRDVELDELLTIQHNTPFEPPDPFWRLCILTNLNPTSNDRYRFTAAFVFHHALGDGTSGMVFHRTFHEALSQVLTTSSSSAAYKDLSTTLKVQSPTTPLLPNVESIHAMPVTIFHLLSILFREKIWSPPRDPGLWTGSKILTPLVNNVRHFAFSRSETTAFKDLCRANGTTITAALQTLVAGALFSSLPDNWTKLECRGALSARRWLADAHIDDDSMGVWIQDLNERYLRDEFQTDQIAKTLCLLPWNEARRSRRTMEQTLALKGQNAGPNLLKYVDDFQKELFLSKVGKERGSSYEVSNLGVFKSKSSPKGEEVQRTDKGEGRAEAEVGRMIFTQSANVTGSAFEVSVVTGQDGCLVLGVSWQKDVVEDTLIEKVIDAVKMEVRRLETAAASRSTD